MVDRSAVAPAPVTPPEVERLLNPAYCAVVLARQAHAYASASDNGARGSLPFPLVHLCLPLVLHGPTRERIRGHNAAYGLHRFVREHPETLVDLPERVVGLVETTREALLFGTLHGLLVVDVNAGTVLGPGSVVRRLTPSNLDAAAMAPIRAAERLGRWFAQISPAEVFLHLGLQI